MASPFGRSIWEALDWREASARKEGRRSIFAAALGENEARYGGAWDDERDDGFRRGTTNTMGYGLVAPNVKRGYELAFATPSPYRSSPYSTPWGNTPRSPSASYIPLRKFPRLDGNAYASPAVVGSLSPFGSSPSPSPSFGARYGRPRYEAGLSPGPRRSSVSFLASPKEEAERTDQLLEDLDRSKKEAEVLYNKAIRAAQVAIEASSSRFQAGSGSISAMQRDQDHIATYRQKRSLIKPEQLSVDVKSLASYRKLIETMNSIDSTPLGKNAAGAAKKRDWRPPVQIAPPSGSGSAAATGATGATGFGESSSSGGKKENLGDGAFMQACNRNIQKAMSKRSLEDAEEEAKKLQEMQKLQTKLDTLDLMWQQGSTEEINVMMSELEAEEKEARKVSVSKKPLSEDLEALYNKIMNSEEEEDSVISKHSKGNYMFKIEDALSLGPGQWLTDENMNFYMALLNDRARRRIEEEAGPKCYFTNTFFLEKLYRGKGSYEYKGVRTWTRKKKIGVDVTQCDKVIVPVHQRVHWCCAVVDIAREELVYYDSMHGKDTQVLENLAKWIKDEMKDKAGKDIDTSSWERRYPRNIPGQDNGYDCGVFAAKFAECSGLDADLDFSQTDMPLFRKQMVVQLAKVDLEVVS
ncbi:ubiquitin-like specific protease [Chloropicon primus]|uniref:Ubiquitin-like specific protease n=1 Tax=Chloropicon primus TaxID=1764295 RepID=A0A5B8MGJ9_9CHLO|nr:ubiquitin-like specific protease [Chloropicon primus]|eukprot:QDZ18472.1 ubiquitin-like specific protease [Chloropicon primus]